MRRGRTSAGFTVLEAVVSLALSLLFVLLAAAILKDVQLASLSLRRQALDPTPQHLAQSLRSDVHRARRVDHGLGSFPGSWSYGSLSLALPDGGVVVYQRADDEISRIVIAADGSSSGARPLLRGVLGWRWLESASDLVEVEVVFRRRPGHDELQRTVADRGAAPEALRMRVAMRAVPGRRSW